MERFAKIVNGFYLLTIFAKSSIIYSIWVLERHLCNMMTMTQVVKCQKLPRNCLSVFDHFVGLTVNVADNSLSKYQTFEQEVLRYLADACIMSLPTLRYSILFTSWF